MIPREYCNGSYCPLRDDCARYDLFALPRSIYHPGLLGTPYDKETGKCKKYWWNLKRLPSSGSTVSTPFEGKSKC